MSQHDPYETMHVEGGRCVELWTSGVPVDAAAKEQLANTARMLFVFSHVVPGSMGARSYIVRGLGERGKLRELQSRRGPYDVTHGRALRALGQLSGEEQIEPADPFSNPDCRP